MRAAVRLIGRFGGTAATALALLLGGLLLVPAVLGLDRYVITGGSMTGTYDRGSLVFDHAVPVADLRVGDVITYRPPASSGVRNLVTHRIVWAGRDGDDQPAFRTKGDANAAADPWQFTLSAPSQARVEYSIPYAGYVLAGIADPRVRFLLVGIPALLIGIVAARRLWRDDAVPGATRA